jgi:hypothetical protein
MHFSKTFYYFTEAVATRPDLAQLNQRVLQLVWYAPSSFLEFEYLEY